MKSSLLLALVATGCVSSVTTTSRSVLPPEQSHAIVKATPDDTARALVTLFTHRGYSLVDQHALPNGQLVLRLKGTREQITEGGKHWTGSSVVGSVFYATLEQSGASLTALDLYGKPTLDGRESCDKPGCEPLYADGRQMQSMTGFEEAEVIHGVIAELALEGLVVPTPAQVATTAHDEQRLSCLDQRRAIFDRAQGISDPYARAKILETAPTCPQ